MRFAVQTKCSSIRPSMSRSRSVGAEWDRTEEMCSYLHGGGAAEAARRHRFQTEPQKIHADAKIIQSEDPGSEEGAESQGEHVVIGAIHK